MEIDEFTDIFIKAKEYDDLDRKFKLICNKGVQEMLHHITILGLNNTEITEQQALNKLAERFPMTTDQIVSTLEMKVAHIEQEKVEVPEFVAEYLEMRKEQFSIGGLGGAITAVFNGRSKPDVSKWMNSNVELFARAWLDGYTVKKEPEWVVAIPGQEAFSGLIEFDKKRKGVSSTCGNQTSVKFTDKAKAEAVALLIGGEIVPVEEDE
ncbi:DUF1642 domain-containing protein [Enterococcus sp. AZ189]|uniref:DUF1642 domain-containing protein n=1 Tax=Enterococcus sp. AZ189 TaxID=2774871 RepID=UPI003F20304E